MARASESAIKALNDLISTCRDSEEGFGKAAKGVHSEFWRGRFTETARKRADFSDELEAEVRRLGGDPATTPHWGGILHRGWVDLEARIRPRIDETFLEECSRGEESTRKHYLHALEQDIPEETRGIVERQFRDVEETLAELRGEERVRRAG